MIADVQLAVHSMSTSNEQNTQKLPQETWHLQHLCYCSQKIANTLHGEVQLRAMIITAAPSERTAQYMVKGRNLKILSIAYLRRVRLGVAARLAFLAAFRVDDYPGQHVSSRRGTEHHSSSNTWHSSDRLDRGCGTRPWVGPGVRLRCQPPVMATPTPAARLHDMWIYDCVYRYCR